MGISLQAANAPAVHNNALVLCCDANYLPYAALAVHTVICNNPNRDFDVCIVSQEPLDLPAVLEGHGVRMCHVTVGDAFDSFPTSDRFSTAAYLRLALPEAFAADYQRLLYMDCDIFAIGGALGDVFRLDLGGMPIGAVRENMQWKYPKRATPDQAALGIAGPYFNSGVLLIDCAAFVAADVLATCRQAIVRHGVEKIYFDQTLMNLALAGKWARLHPAWNWQWAVVRPMFEVFIDVQLVHFITLVKPWSDPNGALPIRYREIARRFFEQYYPDIDVQIAPAAQRIGVSKMLMRLVKHATRARAFLYLFNTHGGDINKVLLPDDKKS